MRIGSRNRRNPPSPADARQIAADARERVVRTRQRLGASLDLIDSQSETPMFLHEKEGGEVGPQSVTRLKVAPELEPS